MPRTEVVHEVIRWLETPASEQWPQLNMGIVMTGPPERGDCRTACCVAGFIMLNHVDEIEESECDHYHDASADTEDRVARWIAPVEPYARRAFAELCLGHEHFFRARGGGDPIALDMLTPEEVIGALRIWLREHGDE